MTIRPRWDIDEVGHGMASGADVAPDAELLAAALRLDDWIAEQPEAHLLPHIERACADRASLARLAGWSVDADGTLVVRLEPVSPDLDRGAWRTFVFGLVGAVAESRTLVRVERDGYTVDVVTGVVDGDTAFAAHGHRLRIVREVG